MLPSLLDFLRHIQEECSFIISVAKSKSQNEIEEDLILSKAIVRSLEIIGEAVKRLPAEFKSKYPQIDWKSIAGMRDRLIHNYFGVDFDIVFNAISNDIPELYNEINRIIDLESPN